MKAIKVYLFFIGVSVTSLFSDNLSEMMDFSDMSMNKNQLNVDSVAEVPRRKLDFRKAGSKCASFAGFVSGKAHSHMDNLKASFDREAISDQHSTMTDDFSGVPVSLPERNVERVWATGNGRGLDLHGQNMRNMKLQGVDFSYADLRDANLSGSTLDYGIFQKTKLQNACLVGVSALGAFFSKARAKNINCTNATLPGARFYKTNLQDARFGEADLSGADFTGSNVKRVDFSLSNVERAIFYSADIQAGLFNGAKGSKADFKSANGEGAGFADGDFHKVNFSGAKLKNTRFNRSDLSKSIFSDSNIKNADFTDSTLTGAEFSPANHQQGARFDRAKDYHNPFKRSKIKEVGKALGVPGVVGIVFLGLYNTYFKK